MKRILTLISKVILVLLAPQLALAQWTEGQEGQLVIRGGWLFDSVNDERRPNTGIVIQGSKIMEVDAESGDVAWSPASWQHQDRPWVDARQRIGNIAIANTDAASNAMTESAIEQAHRAVNQLM